MERIVAVVSAIDVSSSTTKTRGRISNSWNDRASPADTIGVFLIPLIDIVEASMPTQQPSCHSSPSGRNLISFDELSRRKEILFPQESWGFFTRLGYFYPVNSNFIRLLYASLANAYVSDTRFTNPFAQGRHTAHAL